MKLIQHSNRTSVLTICFLVSLLACQCSTKPRRPVNEIQQMIGKMALEAESRSVSGVTDFLTEDFQGDGRVFGGNKQSLTRGIQTIFLRRGKIFVLPFLEYVDVDKRMENATGKILLVVTDFKIEWEELTIDLKADVVEVSITLIHDDRWLVKEARWKRSSLAYAIAEVLQQDEAN